MPSSIKTQITSPSTFSYLSKPEWKEYLEYLETFEHVDFDLSISVMAGCLGVRKDILRRAAQISDIYYRTCRALHAKLPHDSELQKHLLRPLACIPRRFERALSSPFFFRFLRADFFINEESGNLSLIEVNSGGAGLTDFLRYKKFLRKKYSFTAPQGFHSLTIPSLLRCILGYCTEQRPKARTIGFAIVENGNDDNVCEYREYAWWMKKHTNIQPVFLELKKGKLTFYDHPDAPRIIQNIGELDAIYVDWFEDIKSMNALDDMLAENDILAIPPASELLFENKHTLSVLQIIERPHVISPADWLLLQNAIIPSFPLEDFREHQDEMRMWNGIVLKMDVDCAGENVRVYKFTFSDIMIILQKQLIKQEGTGITWTVQQYRKPPYIKPPSSHPAWVEYDYSKFKFDIMTFLVREGGHKNILFGSREFTRQIIEDITPEGANDGFMCPVCNV